VWKGNDTAVFGPDTKLTLSFERRACHESGIWLIANAGARVRMKALL
jgi:hypothetical protein